jgi:hypothetical protein
MLFLLRPTTLPAASDAAWSTDLLSAWQKTQEVQRPLLILITSKTCRYCTLMKQSYAHPDVALNVRSSFVPVLVDADDVPQLVTALGIKAYPTTLIVAPDRRLMQRIKGYVPPEELKQRLAGVPAGGGNSQQRAAPGRGAQAPGVAPGWLAGDSLARPPVVQSADAGVWSPRAADRSVCHGQSPSQGSNRSAGR